MAYILEYTKNGKPERMELPDNLTVDELNLDVTDGVKIPDGLKCKKLDLVGAENVELGKDMQVDELTLFGIDGVKIPDGLKCEYLGLEDAKNVTLPNDLEVDVLEVDEYSTVSIPPLAKIGKIIGNDNLARKYEQERVTNGLKRGAAKVKKKLEKVADKVKQGNVIEKIKNKINQRD